MRFQLEDDIWLLIYIISLKRKPMVVILQREVCSSYVSSSKATLKFPNE